MPSRTLARSVGLSFISIAAATGHPRAALAGAPPEPPFPEDTARRRAFAPVEVLPARAAS